MRDLPFNVSILVFALYLGVIVAGAAFTSILKSMGIEGFWGIFLAIILALPVGNAIRYGVGKLIADASGDKGPHPTAFNFPVRMLIGAIVAVPVALMINIAINGSEFYEYGAMVGAVAAFVTTMIIAGIFYARFSLKE